MDFSFTAVSYERPAFLDQALPAFPKSAGVYKIFDTRGRLIVLDKTSNLFERMERYFGPRSEKVRDLDLSLITSRIEFIRTFSPFEAAYVLYLERRRFFPKTYRKMRTFRFFTLMKIPRRQRFPRIYASRDIRAGADYFGPFDSRHQFNRLKTLLERTFKLRPCLYDIRGGDPHPDCMYFQMHTCSRPCNNDIDRPGYLADVDAAIAFTEGRDEDITQPLMEKMQTLATEMKFEEAERAHRQLERIRRARSEWTAVLRSLWKFDCLAVLPSDSAAACTIAFVRAGAIVGFKRYPLCDLGSLLTKDLERCYAEPAPSVDREQQYDEFCLVCNFPDELLPISGDIVAAVERRLEERRRRPRA